MTQNMDNEYCAILESVLSVPVDTAALCRQIERENSARQSMKSGADSVALRLASLLFLAAQS